MSAFVAFLVGLALSPQFDCAGSMRALADQLTDRTVRTPSFANELRLQDAAAIDDRAWIAVTDSAVIEWRDGAERTLLELPEPRFHWKPGDLRLGANGAWSYAGAAFDDPNRVDVALLASGDSDPQLTRLAVPVSGVPLVWLSLATSEPSAVLVRAGAGATIEVDRITRAGAQRIATIDAPNFYPPGASVSALPDGRVVLAALGDDPRVARTVVLHVMSAAGDVEARLRAAPIEPLRELFMTTSPTGLLCVVARSENGRLAAAIVDVDHPAGAEFRIVTAPDDRAVAAGVVHTEDRFVVAWISDVHAAVVAREWRDDRVPLPPVTVVPDVQRDIPLLSLRQIPGGVSILTRARAGLTLRPVVTPIAGRALALEYVRVRCGGTLQSASWRSGRIVPSVAPDVLRSMTDVSISASIFTIS